MKIVQLFDPRIVFQPCPNLQMVSVVPKKPIRTPKLGKIKSHNLREHRKLTLVSYMNE